MGARIRAFDWASTPLGPPETWPESLRTCMRVMLSSRQPMFVWWSPALLNLYNDAYRAVLGGKHPDALGRPAEEVWREIWDVVGPRVEIAMRGETGVYDEERLFLMERNGYVEETYYTFSYNPIPDGQGGTGGVLCANTDDTRRIHGERQLSVLREVASRTADAKTAEEACRSSAEALATNAKDLPFALVYLLDESGRTLRLAGQAGIEPDHPKAPPRIAIEDDSIWPFAEVLLKHQPMRLEACGGLPSGDWTLPPTSVHVLPLASASKAGRAGALVVGLSPVRLFDDDYRSFLDLLASQITAAITNAQAYANEKRRAESLAELDHEKTLFFSNVSHEFRTPLTLMLGPLEDALASRERRLHGPTLDTTYRNAVRLLKLVNTLLDFSQIEAGRAQAAYAPTGLGELTADLASAFRSAIERAGLRFEVDCEPLPEPVFVDHDMWEKIVLNLLSNALKFTFDGSIGISLAARGDQVELVVRDTGTGISREDQQHLFERFRRVQGIRSRTHEGSGIGLALAHELTKLHGGTIRVESRYGEGTTFTLTIPFGHEHLPADRVRFTPSLPSIARGAMPYVQEALQWLPGTAIEPTVRVSSTPSSLFVNVPAEESGARILLVDDNADMRAYVGRLLGEKWTIEAAHDGLQALDAIRERRPDLVVTDVMMPNLDGFGLLQAIRRDAATRTLPVIMLSARAGEESRVDGLEAGADDYLVKPFSARELIARVSTHLQLSKLRAAAERERAKLFELFMQAPGPVAVFSGPELRYEVANPPYCDMLDRGALVGRTVREAFPEIGEHRMIGMLEQVYETGARVHVAELEVPITRRGVRTQAYFDFVAQPIVDVDDTVTGVMVVAVDVTEQVSTRLRIESLRATAEQASRAKDAFLSTLSHELRTPLNAIVGWSGLLRSGAVSPDQHDKALETIERNARIQARLIEDMLDLSRIEQGKLVLHVSRVNVARVVEAAVEAVRPAADAKGVALETIVEGSPTLAGDADRLQQVVWNLLSNAIKFTPKRGHVRIGVRHDAANVEIEVVDDGQGIEPAFLDYVFDRFRQGDPSFARKAGGLGLGLSIVRSLVELHGGTVRAESEGAGRGSRFVVLVPSERKKSDDAPSVETKDVRAQEPTAFERPAVLRGLRVLVVDDEPDARELMRFLITSCGAIVTTASRAAEATSHLQASRFDLLISDVGMPEEDGYSLVRRLRASEGENARIPALAITAYARAEDRIEALTAGFSMHTAKPIEPAELLALVGTLLRSTPQALPPSP